MNENTDKQMAESLQWLQGVGEQVTDLAAEQMPLIAQEIITRGLYIHGTAVGIGLGMLVVGLFFLIRFKISDDEFDLAVGFFTSVIALAPIIAGSVTLIMIITSPRLYVIERIAELIN